LQIAEASAEYIARPIASGGLSNQKAKAIRNLLDMIVARFGAPTLKPLFVVTAGRGGRKRRDAF
jgi:endonuclease-3